MFFRLWHHAFIRCDHKQRGVDPEGDDPTADKPQSKLWHNDGFWWAVMFNPSAGSWRIYIEAAMLRLQMEFREQLLSGMDLVVNSNIPVAAGMSSSSALVVATGEAAVASARAPRCSAGNRWSPIPR